MRITELLLPKHFDKNLPPKQAARLDMLQQRMNAYVDKICDQNTSPQGREFLKAKLKDDYIEMKKHIIELDSIPESEEAVEKYEVYDKKTGKTVGVYASKSRARLERDKKDMQYGAIRYAIRTKSETNAVSEAYPNQQLSLFNPDGKTYRKEKMPTLDDDDPVNNAERYGIEHDEPHNGNFDSIDWRIDLERALPLFPKKYRRMLEMYYLEDMTFAEIGKILGYSAPYIRMSLNTANLRLRKYFTAGTKPTYATGNGHYKSPVAEAVHICPVTDDDFKVLKEIMERPIPAAIAPIYLQDIIEDDELNDQLLSLEEDQPNRDVRPLIADWVNRVMPDQMYRFKEDEHDPNIARGILSPLHGYHQKNYKAQGGEAIMGDAYGQF
jgi:RNA polymerase sigma factor (sigma-70 family)